MEMSLWEQLGLPIHLWNKLLRTRCCSWESNDRSAWARVLYLQIFSSI